MTDLSDLLTSTEATIVSATVDQAALCMQYKRPYESYDLALCFVLERFCFLSRSQKATGIVLLESRGKQQDRHIRHYIRWLQANGNGYNPKELFQRIRQVIFRPKRRTDGLASYVPLELADLYSYPIHQHIRDARPSRAFDVTERKLAGYPTPVGRGLKLFPSQKGQTQGKGA